MKVDDFRLLASALRFLKACKLEVNTRTSKSLVVSVHDDVIDLDFLDPELFSAGAKRNGLLETLQEARELGKALADKEITISFSRKSKPALKIGSQAKPSLPRIVTRSKEIQVLSARELRALDRELFRQKNG